jgi:hypothetical protein
MRNYTVLFNSSCATGLVAVSCWGTFLEYRKIIAGTAAPIISNIAIQYFFGLFIFIMLVCDSIKAPTIFVEQEFILTHKIYC